MQCSGAVSVRNLWQHPFVDVFKHFKIMPTQDWKVNKKQGDVSEIFAKEIGRKVMQLSGTISANNFIQIPNPSSMQHTLGLTGRYLYLQIKAPVSSAPFSFHVDLTMCERSHGIRISASNLYKKICTQNGFAMQVPLTLDFNRWTVVVFDIYELLKNSRLLPASYLIEGSYQIKGITLCANSQVRGVFTSENLYNFTTLPPDMRFKFQFDINRWHDFFSWKELPQDLEEISTEKKLTHKPTQEAIETAKVKAIIKAQAQGQHLSAYQMKEMQIDIENMLINQKQAAANAESAIPAADTKVRYDPEVHYSDQNRSSYAHQEAGIQRQGYGRDLSNDERSGFDISEKRLDSNQSQKISMKGLPYTSGQLVGAEIARSQKLNMDPIMELKHIIGYSPSSCLNLKWSKIPQENIVMFSSAGVLITMDVETMQQKRFFFGHSTSICCFDIAQQGGLVASAQEGKNSIIRIWDYHTARCLSMLPMPVVTMKCLSFSPDGRFLASVGKDAHNKELIVVWDLSRIHKNEKPEILARQTSDFNILCLKFSPIDNYRLVSCGKENIRFWRIKETGNIRGSAVVLNQHARNTVFTSLDFEHGAKAAANINPNPDSRENEALKRVYVASKSGMVFQINYATETLEATYKTNDSSIYTLAVNEAFCVTGSEDNFLRVWPLDFSEFVMEAKHEGTVCSVDISADGLRVVCGTLYGSLGVLDKSNQRYRTLIRAHTDQILSMDFHLALQNIITVSMDGTIRLWDLKNFEQVIEFNSPLEMPLCVAAHPTLPLFSCGFQTGTMRVFDIEKTCVASDFTQFNKAIRSLAYSQTGDLLVTCCEDGSFAVHNARRQHLPTKMVHLEFAPQFVHVAFSPVMIKQKSNAHNYSQSYDQNSAIGGNDISHSDQFTDGTGEENQVSFESLFAVMGEYGNSVMIYSSDSVVLRHQIQVGTVVKCFTFSKNGREIIVVTKDQRIRFYSLSKFEGVYLKELCTVHRGSIKSADLSNNGGFMLTGGEDNLIKMWDYEAQMNSPSFFQAFIGHTYPIVNTMFNPLDNGMIFSAGERDGIFIWQFHGDTQTKFFPAIENEPANDAQTERDTLHQPSVLEKMRAKVQERRKPQLAEFSFILPEFKVLPRVKAGQLGEQAISEIEADYYKRKYEEGLSDNHFISLKDRCKFKVDLSDKLSMSQLLGNDFNKDESLTLQPYIVNGYDGFSGVHENLIWNPYTGCIIYTLNNKVIIEQTKTREQTVLAVSTVRLSCLAQSSNGKFLAAAEGETNEQGQSFIYLIDLIEFRVKRTLVFHQKGIQSVAFGLRDKLIISVGVKDTHCLVLHSVEYGNAIKPTNCRGHSTNKIIVQEDSKDTNVLMWVTVGNQGSVNFWQIAFDENCNVDAEIRDDFPSTDVMSLTVDMPNDELALSNFVTGAFKDDKVLVGCSDGTLCAFTISNGKDAALEHGRKAVISKQRPSSITQISIRHNNVVVANAAGSLFSYSIGAGTQSLLPPEDMEKISQTNLNAGCVTAVSMDEKNEEGMIGTSQGKIFYVSLKEGKDKKQEKFQVQLISKASLALEKIDIVRFDPLNPRVFMANCGPDKGDIKLISSSTMDTVFTFKGLSFGGDQGHVGKVKFITSSSAKKSELRMVGYAGGLVRFISLGELEDKEFYQLDINCLEGEELTCGCYSANGSNWAVGTSFGSIILGASLKDLFKKHIGYVTARIDGLIKSRDFGVTSIQMTSFNPTGQILAAFANGEVKLWKSYISDERIKKLREQMDEERARQGKKKTNAARQIRALDIIDIGIQKFDIIDSFDMFEHPHGILPVVNNEENIQMRKLYSGKRYPNTQAIFDPHGSHASDLFFCCVEALQYIYIRNFHDKTFKCIALDHFPTQMRLLDCNKFPKENSVQKNFTETVACVGTKEGKVLVYHIEMKEKHFSNLIAKTKAGVMYGEVSGLSVQEDGNLIMAASSTGELASFQLLQHFA